MNRTHTRTGERRQHGFTMIEIAVATGIAAAAVTAVVPGMSMLGTQQALKHAAAEFETDVQHVRSLAVAGNETWRISFGQDGAHTCYIVHTGPAGDCACQGSGPALCAAGSQALRTVTFVGGGRLSVAANVGSIAFDPTRGTSTPAGTVRFVATNGHVIHQVVNVMGRVRSCSPAGAVPGYKAC